MADKTDTQIGTAIDGIATGGSNTAADVRGVLDDINDSKINTDEIGVTVQAFFDTAIEIDITASTAAAAYDIPSDWKGIRLIVSRFDPVTDGATLLMRVGTGGSGGSFLSTAVYINTSILLRNLTTSTRNTDQTGFLLTPDTSTSTANTTFSDCEIAGFNEASQSLKGRVITSGLDATPEKTFITGKLRVSTLGNYNAIQLFCDSGNISNLQARIERLV